MELSGNSGFFKQLHLQKLKGIRAWNSPWSGGPWRTNEGLRCRSRADVSYFTCFPRTWDTSFQHPPRRGPRPTKLPPRALSLLLPSPTSPPPAPPPPALPRRRRSLSMPGVAEGIAANAPTAPTTDTFLPGVWLHRDASRSAVKTVHGSQATDRYPNQRRHCLLRLAYFPHCPIPGFSIYSDYTVGILLGITLNVYVNRIELISSYS